VKVTNKIDIHLDDPRIIPKINAMQGDANTRVLEFSLYAGGVAWEVPDGVSVAVAYSGASGEGIYDTLEDGSAACTVAGNVVTAVVTPQAVAMDGETKLTIVFTDGNGKQLSSFCVTLKVEKNPAVNATRPPDYINLRQWISAELSALLEELGVNNDFIFEVVGDVNTDATMADILAAEEAGRTVYCRLETDGQIVIMLPKVKDDHGVYYFSAVCEGVEYLVTILQDDAGNTVTNVTHSKISGGGSSGVYVGEEEPTDPNVVVWINSEGEIPPEIDPVAATEEMTQPVGVTPEGLLVTAPGGGVDTYSKKEIDTIMGSYITDIDALIGGGG
jgi:hypothetical protein